MNSKRLHLVIVLTALSAAGAWAVHAQELFLPPPVLQPDAPPAPEKKAPAPNLPLPKLPLPVREKSKGADPTLIIPPEVYDLPVDGGPGIVLTGGIVPAPLFPPSDGKSAPMIPPPMVPIPEPKVPIPEPKALPIPEPKTPPSLPNMDPKPVMIPPAPPPLPEPTKVLVEPLSKDPPVIKPAPPTVVFPPARAEAPIAPPVGSKAFVRLRSAANDAIPTPMEVAPAPPPPTAGVQLAPLVLPNSPTGNAMLSLPAITIEKRGSTNLRAGETHSYQIVIRNLGSTPAQQLRIEDDIPVGVKLLDIAPQPQWQGPRAVWTMSNVAPNSEHLIRMTLKADKAIQLGNTLSAHVSAMPAIQTVSLRPSPSNQPLAVTLTGPERASVGKSAVFEIQLTNRSGLPLTRIVLFGYLPEGLNTEQGREIEGAVGGMLKPGETKVLKMPANAVQPGRYTVRVKVATSAGEASATSTLEIAAETLTVQQAPMTRLMLGRDGDLHIQVANGTGKALRNVAVASQLPEGLDYVAASDRGLFQSNHRTVYWLIDTMPAGQTQTLVMRVRGTRPGQIQHAVSVKADGIAEIRSVGAVALEGSASLKMSVVERDNPLEVNKETVYEVQIANTGAAPARNVRLQAQFPAAMTPRQAQGNTQYSIKDKTVVFEPIAALAPDGTAVYRISAHAQATGDQRVQFAIVSDEAPTPIQREVSTKVY